jgi:hypothetical protein
MFRETVISVSLPSLANSIKFLPFVKPYKRMWWVLVVLSSPLRAEWGTRREPIAFGSRLSTCAVCSFSIIVSCPYIVVTLHETCSQNSILDGIQRLTSFSSDFASGTYCRGCGIRPGNGLDAVAKKKKIPVSRESSPGRPACKKSLKGLSCLDLTFVYTYLIARGCE